MSQFGAGAEKATQFYGQVAADDATNRYVAGINKILYGDPSKQVPQADGTVGPDTGYMGLKGADKLHAYADVQKSMETARNEVRAGLSTPQSQLEFDQYSRRYAQLKMSEIGTDYERAHSQYAVQTNKDAAGLSINNIARVANDDNAFNGERENLRTAYVKAAHVLGADENGLKVAVQNADRDAWKMRIETIGALQPQRAREMASEHKGELGADWATIDEHLRSRADAQTGTERGQGIAADLLANKSQVAHGKVGGTTADVYQSALASGDVHSALRASEGLRTDAYWDVNHWRTGYGSDSITHPDGSTSVVGGANGANPNIKPSTTITPEDAERDLRRRAGEYSNKARQAIGPQWESFGANTKAALTSIAYNYGHVPDNVVNAARTGNPAAIAQAIARHAGDNAGANSARRLAEAAAVAGGPVAAPAPAAGGGTPAPNPAGGFPTEAPAPESPGSPASPAAPGAPPAAPAAVPAPEPDYAALKAEALKRIDASTDMSWEAKQHARSAVSQELATQEMIAGATEREKKERNEKSANGYVTELLGGNPQPNMIKRIATDPNLQWQTKEHLYDIAAKHGGSDVEESANTYGPAFWNLFKSVTLPPGSPGKIADIDDIMRHAGPGGDLTLAGVAKLAQVSGAMRKDADQASIQQAKTSMMNYARSKLTFDQDMLYPGVPPLKDQKGVQIFESQFVPKFLAAFDQHVKDGQDPWKFLTQENVDKMVAGARDPKEMAAAKLSATTSTDLMAGKEAKPDYTAPQGINPDHWSAMVSSTPTLADGARSDPETWVKLLDRFGKNPTPEMAKAFDQYQAKLSAAGQPVLAITGDEILAGLFGKITPTQKQPAPPAAPFIQIGKPNLGNIFSPALRRDIGTAHKFFSGEK